LEDLNGVPCNEKNDATIEEVLHVIQDAVAVLYPDVWGK